MSQWIIDENHSCYLLKHRSRRAPDRTEKNLQRWEITARNYNRSRRVQTLALRSCHSLADQPFKPGRFPNMLGPQSLSADAEAFACRKYLLRD